MQKARVGFLIFTQGTDEKLQPFSDSFFAILTTSIPSTKER
jgi:hypothetical protein